MSDVESNANPVGRPPWNPDDTTRERIRTMSVMGIRVKDIATLEKVGETTLRKYCADELAIGKAQGAQTAFSVIGQMMRGYRTVRGGSQLQVDEKTQLQSALKHLNLVHGIHEGAPAEVEDAAPLPWTDD